MQAKTKYDIISIGDAMLDTFVRINNASLLCSLNKEQCWFCLNYAEKIPIEELKFTLGGNACNNAVGSARLGMKAAFYSIIGDDDSGRRIIEQIKGENVSSEYVVIQKGKPTNYSVVLTYKTERTILVYHYPRKYQLPKLAVSKWIYLTSMGKGFDSIHKDLLLQLKFNGTKLAFNPGTHQLLAGRKVLQPVLKVCSVLILNKEEALMILGLGSATALKDILRQLHNLGPDMIVVTDGSNGAYGFDGHRCYFMKVMRSKVVQRTGAGDSFSTGVIGALFYGKSLPEALQWGTANAASVIEHIGPQTGLLTPQQLKKRIKGAACACKEI
jgi:ribokinase